ncbi:15.2 kDa [Spodoptera frugiperda ascovirus 1a]|uniref:15.2 kDa n=1 Tax=Spodoptera frugiperda ascovirus 1a TaxID=113370 RepID=Q0E575_SFAVA|nr:15.2 kDa [Spodoptera frugiperda ascovirus 1a]CAL44626.1 15.2 kDa [Spodoptera frugiperda ascovirus 1a]
MYTDRLLEDGVCRIPGWTSGWVVNCNKRHLLLYVKHECYSTKVYKTETSKLQKYIDYIMVVRNANIVPPYLTQYSSKIHNPNASIKDIIRNGVVSSDNVMDALRLYGLKRWSTGESSRRFARTSPTWIRY